MFPTAALATTDSTPYEDLIPIVPQDILDWANDMDVGSNTFVETLPAVFTERNIWTGEPQAGTGKRMYLFYLLALFQRESLNGSIEAASVVPEEPNVTGQCLALQEITENPYLSPSDKNREIAALKHIASNLDLNYRKIYGACGSGVIGFSQTWGSQWEERLPGKNPWERRASSEYTTRYLIDRGEYFIYGIEHALWKYHPNGSYRNYVGWILNRAWELRVSFDRKGLSLDDIKWVEWDEIRLIE